MDRAPRAVNNGARQLFSRALFGVWINVSAAVVAICIRSTFRSHLKNELVSGDRTVNFWRVSPAVTSSEVFELRNILARALIRGDLTFFIASTFCILTAIVGAASTTISNHVIVTNLITRNSIVPGRLVTHEHSSLAGAVVELTSRVNALYKASAPLEELFDFIPSDDVSWVYQTEQWNNTWQGRCSFVKHEAVDLVVYPTNTTNYQDEIPLLGNYIPRWATMDRTKQGAAYVGFYYGVTANGTGAWRDQVVTYVFGTAPANNPGNIAPSVNISLVNYLAHNIARDPYSTYLQTTFKSDVHVVDCKFDNSVSSREDQAYAEGGNYVNAAGNVANMYNRAVVEASIAEQEVVQPTAQEMLRYWQAFMSVKDSQYPHPVERTLAVSQWVVQIRLSALVGTIGAVIISILVAATAHVRASRKCRGVRVHLPGSQFDWMVQAAREHYLNSGNSKALHSDLTSRSPTKFALSNQNLTFAVASLPNEQPNMWIMAPSQQHSTKRPISEVGQQPELSYFDPRVLYENSSGLPQSPASF